MLRNIRLDDHYDAALHELSLTNQHINDTDIPALIALLPQYPEIHSLNLSGNFIGAGVPGYSLKR